MGRVFKPKRKVAHHIKVGGGALYADFYVNNKDMRGCYLHIYAPNTVFEHKVTGNTFGYLLTAVEKGNEREVEAYCAMIWRLSMEIYDDIELCRDVVSALTQRDKRLMEKGAVEAAKVTEEQNEADEALMREIARDADKANG